MTRTIWKFELKTKDIQTIKMPIYAKILSIQSIDDVPYIYALIDKNASVENRIFEVFGTRHPIEYGIGTSREYIGTYKLYNGALMCHVFEYTGI